jgi:hypothetical protein
VGALPPVVVVVVDVVVDVVVVVVGGVVVTGAEFVDAIDAIVSNTCVSDR